MGGQNGSGDFKLVSEGTKLHLLDETRELTLLSLSTQLMEDFEDQLT